MGSWLVSLLLPTSKGGTGEGSSRCERLGEEGSPGEGTASEVSMTESLLEGGREEREVSVRVLEPARSRLTSARRFPFADKDTMPFS
jgi:hypothetical protein